MQHKYEHATHIEGAAVVVRQIKESQLKETAINCEGTTVTLHLTRGGNWVCSAHPLFANFIKYLTYLILSSVLREADSGAWDLHRNRT